MISVAATFLRRNFRRQKSPLPSSSHWELRPVNSTSQSEIQPRTSPPAKYTLASVHASRSENFKVEDPPNYGRRLTLGGPTALGTKRRHAEFREAAGVRFRAYRCAPGSRPVHAHARCGSATALNLLQSSSDFRDGDCAFAEDFPLFVLQSNDGRGQTHSSLSGIQHQR